MKVVIVTIFVYTSAFAQPVYELEPVVVTGSRIPTKLAQVLRNVTIISGEEIESMPVHSVAELLNYFIDMRQRNIYSVQSDASIRGSSFEQVLVLIDGVAISDPQTGHHNLDIPLTLGDINRIEILRGHGSSLYGANAFGGAINIITKQNTDNRQPITELGGSYGSYGTYTVNLGSMNRVGPLTNRLSLEKQKSDGYEYDTDFDNLICSFGSTFKNLFNISLGFVDKDFGAYHFYGSYPSKEKTKTKFISCGMNPKAIRNLIVEPKVYYREHYDKFILFRDDTARYTNYHTNYRYGGEFTCYFGNTVLGTEVNEERINSTGIRGGIKKPALGEHSRQNGAIYSEFRSGFKNLLANIGGRVDYNSRYGAYISPSLSIGYKSSDRLKCRSSIGKSFRAPTFTELYYQDPVNIGDSTLKAEQGIGYEIGTDYQIGRNIKSSVTLFIRETDNLIDWVRTDTTLPWRVKNIREATTKGIESGLNLGLGRTLFAVEYTFLHMDSKVKGAYFSKYALNYLKHQFSVKVRQDLWYGIEIIVCNVFKQRFNEQGYFILDAQVSKKIGSLLFSLKGTNLLDTVYEEIQGIEMPGRWLEFGLRLAVAG